MSEDRPGSGLNPKGIGVPPRGVGSPDPSHGTNERGRAETKLHRSRSRDLYWRYRAEKEEKRERAAGVLGFISLGPTWIGLGAGPREGGRCFFLIGPPLAGSDSARSRRGEPGTGPILRYGAILRYPMLPNIPPFLFS